MEKNNIQIGEYTIPEGYEAEIKDGKVIVKMTESEDERKRKELISFLDMHLGTSNKPSCTPKQIRDWIAYLEKQGEQSIDEIEDLSVRKYMKLDKFALANMLAERDKNNIETIKAFEKLEKQGKIPKFKSGDTIEFNGFGRNRYTIKDVCGTSHYINTNGGRMDMSYTDGNFELVEQKPVERSEEDKEILERCISLMSYNDAAEEETRWLRSLRGRYISQNHWEVVDKEIYVREPALVQRKDKTGPNHGYVICYDHTLTPDVYERYIMLSDVISQKQWKPSEEQLLDLLQACNFFNVNLNPLGGRLNILYEQLKSL